MKRHVKIYYDYFGYGEDDFVPCEICGRRDVDVNHIDCRGMGGSKLMDFIENLMGLCREHHDKYGDKKQWMDWLIERHQWFMQKFGINTKK